VGFACWLIAKQRFKPFGRETTTTHFSRSRRAWQGLPAALLLILSRIHKIGRRWIIASASANANRPGFITRLWIISSAVFSGVMYRFLKMSDAERSECQTFQEGGLK
jgi:hypothetical protein